MIRFLSKLLGVITIPLFLGFFYVHSALAVNYTLSGTVQDSTTNGIEGATVNVYNPGTTTDVLPPTTTAPGTGAYSFTNLPSGIYDIKVTPVSGSGFTAAIALSQNIVQDTTLNFILSSSGSVNISGHLYDAAGHPLLNQRVTLNLASGGQVGSVTTNSSGSYSFQVSANSYNLNVAGNNNGATLQVPEVYSFTLPNTSYVQSTIRDIYVNASKVSVHVKNAAGQGVGSVVLKTSGGNVGQQNLPIGGGINVLGLNSYPTTGVTTDSSGDATMWLFPGTTNTYTIVANPANGSGYTQTISNNNSVTGDTDVPITLQQAIIINGHLYDAANHPLQFQQVILNLSSGGQVGSVTTDASGSYTFQTSPNSYNLTINGNNHNATLQVPESYSFSLANRAYSQNTTQDIIINASKVSVHVKNAAGQGVGSVVLKTLGGNVGQQNLPIGGGITVFGLNGYLTNGVTTNSSGDATMWLFPGTTNTYTIVANPPNINGYSQTISSNNSVTGDTDVPITLQQTITISGHIYDAANHPLQFQQVILNLASGGQVGSVTTNSSGSYSFQVSANSYNLNVAGNNNGATLQVPEVYSFTLPNTSYVQNTVQDFTIPASKVKVHVQDVFGTAISGVLLKTSGGNVGQQNLPIGGGVTVFGLNGYLTNGVTTDSSGDGIMWLFPGNTNNYTVVATPPTGSIYSQFPIAFSVSGDQSELIQLQYNHNAPSTTINLATDRGDGTYTDPTTVTLSATAASGYTVPNGNTFYTLDNGNQQTYSAPFTVTGSGSHTITYWSIDNSGAQETHHVQSFTIVTTHNLTGTVYVDSNQNGLQDSGEQGFAGATITLNTNQAVTTDSNGNYSFTNLPADTYVETLTLPNGYTITTANPVNIALNADTTQNFGIFSGPILTTAINAGGNTSGSFANDTAFNGGSTYSGSTTVDTTGVTNPAPQDVYQTVRYGNFSYTIPNLTPNASYTLRLHFNELYWNSAGSRVFNVNVNNTPALSNYDIYQNAGGQNKAVIEQIPTTADSSGNITVQFVTVTDNAIVSGIELYSGTLPSPTPTPTPTPISSISINSGDGTYGSFVADRDYSGGSSYTSSNSVDTSNVTNPAPQGVYQTVRYGNNMSYVIPGLYANTNYLVRLHFSEPYWTNPGQRMFDVAINGTSVLSNFDILKTAGSQNKALVEQFNTTSDQNGKITVAFTTETDNAIINGIEINQNTVPTYTLSGTVYSDANSNGVQDIGEQGVAGVAVKLNTGQTATTDANGDYSFSNLPQEDTYQASVTVPNGSVATTANPVTFALNANTTENFGISQFQSLQINSGGASAGSYIADSNYTGGTTYSTSSSIDVSGVTNPAPQGVYQTVRYGNFSYTVPNLTPNDTYTVRLHFNELYWNSAGSRVFNVTINGSNVLNNFDIYQSAGGQNKADVEQFTTTADSNGVITIGFQSVTDNAIVSGIEVIH